MRMRFRSCHARATSSRDRDACNVAWCRDDVVRCDVFSKKKASQKPIFFFKTAKKLHTGNTWLDSGGKGGDLPNTHLWRILKKSHPKMAPKWQRRIGNANSFTAHRICWSYYQKFVEVVVHNHLCFAS